MKSNYRKIGEFIRQCNDRNEEGSIDLLLGVNLDKKFMPSVANINGTDLTKYKIIRKGQFGCKLMSVGRDKKLPISRLTHKDIAIISTAYFVFEVIDENHLLPEYLMMWFKRSESDRFLWFLSGGDIRGRITWDDLCSLPIKVPSIEKQQQIVNEYNTIINRIALNEQLNQKLEETAQALYKHWFVDFEFPNEEGNPYKSSGGVMVYNEELDKEIPEGWWVKELKNFTSKMTSGATPNRSFEKYWSSKDFPWLKTGELKNQVIIDSEEYISSLALKESSAKIIPVNAVLVAMYGQGDTKVYVVK
ncbi:restriction endonuclease subunit S [Muriicola sp. Z0-33]|uniref:restriction endonuclease subunit S n=1 Tax=Muriicola sp. Z0-33 TaxID=2816957 RepID=UPI0022372B53|nr:restriction endonuclease subunit S [Muriicola sp. Z0-33]MCW5518062.1 restriction endonuclease subunit S [Muriicola sp. Z0-33]